MVFLLEHCIYNLFKEKNVHYWRTTAKAEVDFVLLKDPEHPIPVEAKSSGKITRSFISFLNNYKPERGFIINFSEFYKKDIGVSKVFVVPASILSGE